MTTPRFVGSNWAERWRAALKCSFGSEAHSDCRIVFVKEGTAIELKSLPAHQYALVTAEFFQSRIERWSEAKSEQQQKAKSKKRSAEKQEEALIIQVPLAGEHEVWAANAVLDYLYSGEVQEYRPAELLQVRHLAQYLGAPHCVADCDAFLMNLEMSWDDAVAVYALSEDLRLQAQHKEALQPVLDKCPNPVLKVCSSASDILSKEELLAKWTRLPLCAIEAVLASNELQTDSENSVLALLAAWVERNSANATPAQLARLCAHVRVVRLTPSYMEFVLPFLGWFDMTPQQRAEVSMYRHALGSSSSWGPIAIRNWSMGAASSRPAWFMPPRPRPVGCVDTFALTWNIPADEMLKKYLGLTEKDGAFPAITSPPLGVRAGYVWRLRVQAKKDTSTGRVVAGLYLLFGMPFTLPRGSTCAYLAANAVFRATCAGDPCARVHGRTTLGLDVERGRGYCDFFTLENAAQWSAKLRHEGGITCVCEVSEVQ